MGWEQAVAIGGKAEQDIASFILPAKTSKALREGNRNARNEITAGYDAAGNKLDTSYEQSRGDVTGGRDQGIGALQTGYAGAEQAQMPYYQQGQQGLNTLAQMNQRGFSFDGRDLANDPGYQFRLQQGMNTIQGGAAAKGGLLSGATQKALAQYGQGFASNEYQNAYNRAQNAYTTNYQTANTLAGYGQNAANQIGSYRTGLGTGSANLYSNAGNNLGTMANQYGVNASNMQISRAEELANLAMQRGMINANEWQGYGNAAINQGKHLQEIGGGQMGASQGGYAGNMGGMMGGGGQMGGSGGQMQFGNDFGGSAMSSAGSAAA